MAEWIIKDTDERNTAISKELRAREIVEAIFLNDSNDEKINKNFCKKCFLFMKDYGILTTASVAILQDSEISKSMFLGGTSAQDDRLAVLKVADGQTKVNGYARYYSNACVECNNEQYYISNEWYRAEKDKPGMWGFAKWIFVRSNLSNRAVDELEKMYDFLYALRNTSVEEILSCYGLLIKELKAKGIIRSKKLLGDIGEYFAVKYYRIQKNVQLTIKEETNHPQFDAISDTGERYSIKSITNDTTSEFADIKEDENDKKFDYVVICKFDDNFNLDTILELTWEIFMKHKVKRAKPNAWQLNITKKLTRECTVIYSNHA